MTLQGAIQQLHDMRSDDNFPIYYKPAIDKVIETILMDAQEVRRGRWEGGKCSVCGEHALFWLMSSGYYASPYCPYCGARMEVE